MIRGKAIHMKPRERLKERVVFGKRSDSSLRI